MTMVTLIVLAALVVGCSAGEQVLGAQDESATKQSSQDHVPGEADAEELPDAGAAAPEEREGQEGAGEGTDVFEAHLTMVDPPEQMARTDEVGASSTAEYFLFAYTYAYGTGDTGPLTDLAAPECGFCASAVAAVQEAHAGEGYMRSGDPLITGASVAESDQGGEDYLVWFDVQLPQMRTFDGDDEVVEIHPASDIRAGLALAHTGEQWLVRGVTFEPAS